MKAFTNNRKNDYAFCIFWGLMLIFSILAVSCAEKPGVPVSKPKAALEETQDIVLLDRDVLKKVVAVENYSKGRNENGFLWVTMNLKNRTKLHQVIEIQTVFKDDVGHAYGDETAWYRIDLDPFESRTYTQTAVTKNASRQTTRIRIPSGEGVIK